MTQRFLAALASASLLAGCSSVDLPNYDSPRIPFFAAMGVGVYYLYKDNWSLSETQAGTDRFRLSLKKNVLRSDGDSEASMLFKRRAGEITAEMGYDGYRIMEYSEGIESASFGPQRVAQGTIQLYRNAGSKN
jgi:hypothetical protein